LIHGCLPPVFRVLVFPEKITMNLSKASFSCFVVPVRACRLVHSAVRPITTAKSGSHMPFLSLPGPDL
jgi:hypothetical protein